MKRITILHILNHVQESGNGIVNVTVDLACLQAQAGHKVAVASKGGSFESLLGQYGVNHFILDQENRKLQNLPRLLMTFWRILKDIQPDIVHAHMMTGAVLASVLMPFCTFKLITHVHNEFQKSAILMGLGHRVIAVSEAVAVKMAKRGVPNYKLRVVANGTLGSPRQGLPPSQQILERPNIVTIAGLYRRKGIADLIAAFARVKQDVPLAHLYIAGEGPDRALFEDQVKRLDLNDVRFLGFVRDPRAILYGADVFVLASHNDPSPLVLPEAREADLPIVATHVDGIPEALDGGEAGILVPAQNPEELASAILDLLRDADKRQAMVLRAGQGLERLRVSRVTEETLAVYADVLQTPL